MEALGGYDSSSSSSSDSASEREDTSRIGGRPQKEKEKEKEVLQRKQGKVEDSTQPTATQPTATSSRPRKVKLPGAAAMFQTSSASTLFDSSMPSSSDRRARGTSQLPGAACAPSRVLRDTRQPATKRARPDASFSSAATASAAAPSSPITRRRPAKAARLLPPQLRKPNVSLEDVESWTTEATLMRLKQQDASTTASTTKKNAST